MAAGVFLDTSGWFAALSPREARHRPALAAYRDWIARGIPLITTNYVVAEMQILLQRGRGATAGVEFLDALHQDPGHRVVYVDRDLESAAVERWLRRFRDKPLSLADAVSFEVIRIERLRQALALDRHFTLLANCELVPQ